jgi:hypothetical protein
VLFFDHLWVLLMDWNEILQLTDWLSPLSCYCQLLSDLASLFHEVKLIAFVPHGMKLSFSH